jgi:hypothetical protein
MHMRMRGWVLLLLGASLALIVTYVAAWATTPTPHLLRADFVNAYLGGQMLRSGQGAQLYDLGLQSRIYAVLTAPYHYPLLPFYDTPSAALLAAPFTLLPVVAAWRVFSLMQLVMVVAAAVIAARAAPWPRGTGRLLQVTVVAAGVAGFSTDVVILQGQWSGLFALGVALGYRELRRGHEVWAAAWLLAPILAVKPNLAIGLFVFVIGWRSRRMLGGLAASAAVVLGASLLVGGPSILGAFVHTGVSSRSVWPLASMDGITGITGRVFGGGGAADAIGFAMCAVVAALAFPMGRLARASGRLEPALAAAVGLSLLASPHLYLQDLVMLTPAAVWVMAWAHARDRAIGTDVAPRRLIATMTGWIAFNVAAEADAGASSGHLVPWALATACIAAVVASGLFSRTSWLRGIVRHNKPDRHPAAGRVPVVAAAGPEPPAPRTLSPR